MAVMNLQFLLAGAVSGYAAYRTLPLLPEYTFYLFKNRLKQRKNKGIMIFIPRAFIRPAGVKAAPA